MRRQLLPFPAGRLNSAKRCSAAYETQKRDFIFFGTPAKISVASDEVVIRGLLPLRRSPKKNLDETFYTGGSQ
jgi:hypothetical protein